jgi:ankyrin repeat domain-containing protein 50
VQQLLERGADINAKGGGCGSALEAASARCHETVVQLLIDRGVKMGGMEIMAAARGGHKEIVQFLIDKGAEMNGNEIGAAAIGRHEKIV